MRVAGGPQRSLGLGPVRGNTRAEQNFSRIAGRAHSSRVSVLFHSTDQACQLESVPSDGMAVAGTYYHRLSKSGRCSTPANRFISNESKAVLTAFRSCERGAWSPGPENERRRIAGVCEVPRRD